MQYFGYGSNLDPVDLKRWCKNEGCSGCELENPCTYRLKDYELGFTTYSNTRKGGVADIIPKPGGFCWGVLFDTTEQIRKNLDKKEGCSTDPSRSFYQRLELPNGAYTYVVVRKKKFVQPHPDYVDVIIRGAKHYGLPEPWISKLESFKKPPA